MTVSNSTPEKHRFGRFSGNPYSNARLYTPSASEMLRSPSQPVPRPVGTPPPRSRSRTGTPPIKTPRGHSDQHFEPDLSQREVDFIDHQAKLRKAHEEVFQLTHEAQAKRQELEQEQESLQKLGESLALRRIKSNVEETEITEKEKRIREKDVLLKQHQQSVQDRANNIAALEKDINDRLVSLEESQRVLDAKESALRQRTVNVQKREAEIEECEAWVESREMETKGLNNIGDVDISELKRTIQALEKSVMAKDKIVEQLEGALAANAKINAKLNHELHSRTLPKAEDALEDKEEGLRQLYESLCAIELRISVKSDDLTTKASAVEQAAARMMRELNDKQAAYDANAAAREKDIQGQIQENKLLVITLMKKTKEDDSRPEIDRQALLKQIESLSRELQDVKKQNEEREQEQQSAIDDLNCSLRNAKVEYEQAKRHFEQRVKEEREKVVIGTPRNDCDSVDLELRRKKLEVDMNQRSAELEKQRNEVRLAEEQVAMQQVGLAEKEAMLSATLEYVRDEEVKLLALREDLDEREERLLSREVLLTARETVRNPSSARSKSACTTDPSSDSSSDDAASEYGDDFASPAACSNASSGFSPAFTHCSPSASTPMSSAPQFSPIVLNNERVPVRRMPDGTELLGCTSDPKLRKKIAKMKKKEDDKEHKRKKEMEKQARKEEKQREKDEKKKAKNSSHF